MNERVVFGKLAFIGQLKIFCKAVTVVKNSILQT